MATYLGHQAIISYWEAYVYDSEIKEASLATFKGGTGSFIALKSRGNSHPHSDILQSELSDAVRENYPTEHVFKSRLFLWIDPL